MDATPGWFHRSTQMLTLETFDGATAMRRWLHGAVGRRRAGFGFADTVFSHILSDPMPHVVELLSKTGAVGPRAIRAFIERMPIGGLPNPALARNTSVLVSPDAPIQRLGTVSTAATSR